MVTETTDKDLSLSKKIENLDLSMVKAMLIVKKGFTETEANNAIVEYKEYLLVAGSASGLIPSPACDEAWHAHILHLPAYMRDCMNLFGRPIWHVPDPISDAQVILSLGGNRHLVTAGVCENTDDSDGSCKTNCHNQVHQNGFMVVTIRIPVNEYA